MKWFSKEKSLNKFAAINLGIGAILILLGLDIIMAGLFLKFFSNLIIQYSDLPVLNYTQISQLKETMPNNIWLNEIHGIEQLVQRLHFENIGSEGLTYMGIGSGFLLSGIPMIVAAKKEVDQIRRTKEFLREDFENINRKLVLSIPILRHTLSDLKSSEKILDDLISKKITPIEVMVQHYALMSFTLWDSAVGRMRDLEKDEQKKIHKLHQFLMDSNNFLEPSNDSMAMALRRILSSEESSLEMKRREMKSFLIETLENNLHNYDLIYKRFLIELNDIIWMKVKDWEKLETEPLSIGAPIK